MIFLKGGFLMFRCHIPTIAAYFVFIQCSNTCLTTVKLYFLVFNILFITMLIHGTVTNMIKCGFNMPCDLLYIITVFDFMITSTSKLILILLETIVVCLFDYLILYEFLQNNINIYVCFCERSPF